MSMHSASGTSLGPVSGLGTDSGAGLPTFSAGALHLDGLSAVRGGRRLFHGLQRRVGPGQLLRIVGSNGAGKTTLLRMVCGLVAPAEGCVRWRGQPVAQERDQLGRDLVYLGHTAALKDDLSALENLEAAQQLAGLHHSLPELRAALDAAGLKGRDRGAVRRLSQGQRQRCALARLALSQSKPLWVLDEPFNALDTAATEWLAGLVRQQLQRGGLVLLTSHQPLPLDGAQQEVLAL